MKKILSLILAVTMVFTLFAGIGVSAEEATMMTAERKRSAYAETSNILGNTVSGTYGKGDNISGSWVYDVPAEPDTHNLSVRLSSDELCGVGVTGNRTYFSFQPYAKITGGVDAFMVYMELPEYNKYGEQWSIRSLSFHLYEEGESGVWKIPCNMTIKYLENDAAEWVTTTVGANGEYYLPSGFKGYIKMYLNTATNGNSTENLYDYLTAQGFDISDGFLVGTLQFDVNYLGGSYGDVVIGGMYNVISDGDALTANLSDEGGAHSKAAKLTGTDRHVSEGVTTFWNQRGNYDVSAGDAITSNVLSSSTLGDATLTWTEPAIGAKHPAMKISSENATGNAYGVTGRLASMMWTPIDTSIGAFGMYLELPTYAEGDEWVIMNKSFAFSDGTTEKYLTPVNMKISYLAVDGKEWVDSITSSSGHFYLPGGFKGYVKCYLKTATLSGSTTSFFDALKENGINYETKLQINAYQFDIKRVGGEYGDLIIGGPYGINADGNSLEANITDWKYSSNVSKITTYEPTLTAERKNYAYFDDTTYYEGAAVDTNTAKIWDLDWYNNYGDPQAALSWTAPVEPDTSNAAIRVHSDTAEGQGPEIGPSNLIIHPNTVIDPEIGAFMMYVELPKQGTPTVDGPNQWATYAIKTNAVTVYQNMSSAKFGRLNNMTVSYIERDGNEWKTATCENENLILPNGFKGYIKLYLNTAIADTSTGKTFYEHLESQSLDTTKEYRITDVNIVFGWLGGKFGDMVVGGMYEITEDGNGIYANISEADAGVKYTCLTTYKKDNENRIAAIEEVLASISANGLAITDGDALINAKVSYNNLADEFKADFSADSLALLEQYEAEYTSKYRPVFEGATVKYDPYEDFQTLRFDTVLTNTEIDGYTATEYGTVILAEGNYADNALFDANAENAVVKSVEGSANAWSVDITSNDRATFDDYYYVRSYVVYSNGTDTVTVWNAAYTSDNEPEFALRRSLVETGAALGAQVMGGRYYGDITGENATDVEDVKELRKILLGLSVCEYEYAADVDNSDEIDIIDLIYYKKYLAGIHTTLGAELSTTISIG